jgi:acetylglutamate kinase
METLSSKAQILADSLPKLRNLQGCFVVVKYGGSVLEETVYTDSVLTDVAFLQQAGIAVILVHGGGKAITNKMREAGITPKFVNGLRYTDQKTVSIVDSVLTKTINPQIVTALNEKGAKACTLSGKKVLKGKKHITTAPDGQRVNLGFVGDVTSVNKAPIMALLKKNIIPVVTPLASGPGGSTLNTNADVAAAKIAGELKSDHLIFLSDTNGILEDSQHPDSTLQKISDKEIQNLCNAGVITGGMLPKVNSSLDALKKGVKRVKLLNGQLAHSILIDLFVESKLGTEIVIQ